MIKDTLKILQHLLKDFPSASDHFGTLCIKGSKYLQSLHYQLLLGDFITILRQCKINELNKLYPSRHLPA